MPAALVVPTITSAMPTWATATAFSTTVSAPLPARRGKLVAYAAASYSWETDAICGK